jgi:muconolactone delta-isomerase
MKYLLMVRVKATVQPSPEVAAALQIHKQYIADLAGRGVVESVYTFAGSGNGCCIISAETSEDLNDLLAGTPAFALCDIDVYPLADFYKQMDRVASLMLRKPPA